MKMMLVPLDGSQASEAVLPVATAVARAGGYEITLFSIWDVGLDDLMAANQERIRSLCERGVDYFRAYLRNLARELEADGVRCDLQVASGHPAAQILGAASAPGVDMVAMATRGRRATEAGRRGSVADKVLRACSVPVLAVGPLTVLARQAARKRPIRRILVPLDGSPESESSLPLALELARGLGARVELLRVVAPFADQAAPAGAEEHEPEIDAERQEEARRYLQRVRAEHGDPIRETHVRGGSPRVEVRRFPEGAPVDLVVMASRSRHAAGLWSLGGVADELIEGPVPVILVSPPQT